MKELTSIQRRDLLAKKDADPATLRGYAEDYFAAESYDYAFEFYDRLQDRDGVTRIKCVAIKNGNGALLMRVADSRSGVVERAEWLEAAENALRLGRRAYAAQAFFQAGQTDRVEELRAQLPQGAIPVIREKGS